MSRISDGQSLWDDRDSFSLSLSLSLVCGWVGGVMRNTDHHQGLADYGGRERGWSRTKKADDGWSK